MPRCGIIILAAGGSTRLGFAKQRVKIDGITLLRRIATQAVRSICKPVVIVLGSTADDLRPELDGLPVTITINEQWQTGMGGSIRRGVAAMLATDPQLDAILIALCDQPRITAAIFDRLTTAFFAAKKSICAAEYAGTVGTPAVFASSVFPEFAELPDNAGGRVVIHRHLNDMEHVLVPEAEIDLDTPEDLQQILSP